MKKLQKTFMKWGAAVAKVSLAAAMLTAPWVPVRAADDFGTSVELLLRTYVLVRSPGPPGLLGASHEPSRLWHAEPARIGTFFWPTD